MRIYIYVLLIWKDMIIFKSCLNVYIILKSIFLLSLHKTCLNTVKIQNDLYKAFSPAAAYKNKNGVMNSDFAKNVQVKLVLIFGIPLVSFYIKTFLQSSV